MKKTENLNVAERDFTQPEDQEHAEQNYEKIVSFLLNRYLKEREQDKK